MNTATSGRATRRRPSHSIPQNQPRQLHSCRLGAVRVFTYRYAAVTVPVIGQLMPGLARSSRHLCISQKAHPGSSLVRALGGPRGQFYGQDRSSGHGRHDIALANKYVVVIPEAVMLPLILS